MWTTVIDHRESRHTAGGKCSRRSAALELPAVVCAREFVDNAVESFVTHRAALATAEGGAIKLTVDIDVDASTPPRIAIRDNAAGIFESDYARAFRPVAIPPNRSGPGGIWHGNEKRSLLIRSNLDRANLGPWRGGLTDDPF